MSDHDRRGVAIVLAALLLLAFFVQAISSAAVKSPTFDEQFHIARAYPYVRTNDLRMQQHHPPLVSLLAGMPLLLLPELTPPQDLIGWEHAELFVFADQLLWRTGSPVEKVMFLARFPIALLGVLLGAFVFRWAREAYGIRSGLLAAGLYAFSPNLLAHTRLITNDFAVTALAFIACYLHWRYLRRPSGARLAWAGLSVGLAISAKQSALLLAPTVFVLALAAGWQSCRPRLQRRRALLLACGRGALVLVVAGLALWAFYRFEVRPWPGTTFPLPATTYLMNVVHLVGHLDRGHSAFLLGQVSHDGWWYYFVVAVGLKTPLTSLGLGLVSAWDTLKHRRLRDEVLMYLYPVVFFLMTFFSTINIGYRHILPVIPFLILYGSKVASVHWLPPSCVRRWVLAGLVLAYGMTTVGLHPHYLAFFNAIAGGPHGGYRYLVDSNLDWGQDLELLADYLVDHQVDQVSLAYFGTAVPRHYGIKHEAIWMFGQDKISDAVSLANPEPGWYAISATLIQGAYLANPDDLSWFRLRQPDATVGHSIFLYHVLPDPDPPRWLASCYAPNQALRDEQIGRYLGTDSLRAVGFDCRMSWVIPAGEGPGWYLVPEAADGPGTVSETWLREAEEVFHQRDVAGRPGYTVYRSSGRPTFEKSSLVREAWSSPILSPASGEPTLALHVPVDVGGSVEFLGYSVSSLAARPGAEVELETAWRVVHRPSDLNLSHFVHLVDSSRAVSVGDAMGYQAIQWSPGDVYILYSMLKVPTDADADRYWVQVGLYSLVTGDRLQVRQDGRAVADRLLLTPIAVAPDGRNRP
jgi:hypothetical protein